MGVAGTTGSLLDKAQDFAAKSGDIMERTVTLSIEICRPGMTRKVNPREIETDADRRLLKVSKQIADSKTYKTLCKADSAFKKGLMLKALPSMFRGGIYQIPCELVAEIDAEITEYSSVKRPELVQAFIAEWDTDAAEGARRLASLANAMDYPTGRQLARQFSIDWRWLTFSTPDKLQGISPSMYARELERAQASIQTVTDEIIVLLRAETADLVDHLVDRLSPAPDGTQKVFRDSLVGNVREFLATFNARNITNDVELAGAVDKVRALLDGVDPGLLRGNSNVRERVAAGFATIKSDLDQMLKDRPNRAVDFSDLDN